MEIPVHGSHENIRCPVIAAHLHKKHSQNGCHVSPLIKEIQGKRNHIELRSAGDAGYIVDLRQDILFGLAWNLPVEIHLSVFFLLGKGQRTAHPAKKLDISQIGVIPHTGTD